MAERFNKCPECKSSWCKTLKIFNPDTSDMNADAMLQCEKCNHVWKDRVTSSTWERDRDRGWIR